MCLITSLASQSFSLSSSGLDLLPLIPIQISSSKDLATDGALLVDLAPLLPGDTKSPVGGWVAAAPALVKTLNSPALRVLRPLPGMSAPRWQSHVH